MDILNAIILGIIEGLTEFLPVSSTGHLILVSSLLQLSQTSFIKSFEIVIQSGAILAVVVLYWRSFLDRSVAKKVLIAFMPTAIIGLVLYKVFKQVLLGNDTLVIASLIIGGAVIILYEKFRGDKKSHIGEISQMSNKQCFLIGVFQSIAIIPGVSRSAATIIGGMSLGVKRETIVKFSFLLAIPTMLAATGYDMVQSYHDFSKDQMGFLAVGFVVSFIVALFAIKLFLKIVRTRSLSVFGIYRIVIGAVFLLMLKP